MVFTLEIIFVLANSVDPGEFLSGSSLSAIENANKVCINSSFNLMKSVCHQVKKLSKTLSMAKKLFLLLLCLENYIIKQVMAIEALDMM